MHQSLKSFWVSAFFHLIANILCDLSLVVALTHDFVIATQGPVSPKHTLHTHCLCVFPVCSISASCTLKLWSPLLGNSAQESLHFTLSGIKAETARLGVLFPLYTCSYKYTQRQNCRVTEYLHKSACSTPLYHTLPFCLSSPLSLYLLFLCAVFYLLTRKAAQVIYSKKRFWLKWGRRSSVVIFCLFNNIPSVRQLSSHCLS